MTVKNWETGREGPAARSAAKTTIVVAICLALFAFFVAVDSQTASATGDDWIATGSVIEDFTVKAINADGTVIAGNTVDSSGYPLVRVYQLVQGDWVVKGSDIVGGEYDNFGAEMILSADGNTLVLSAPQTDFGVCCYYGRVHAFRFSNGAWSPLGAPIDDPTPDGWNFFGLSIDASADGETVVVASRKNGSYIGLYRVFSYVGGTWQQVGATIEVPGEYNTPSIVNISSDGNTIAVGAGTSGGLNLGDFTVYTFNGSTWVPVGSTIQGVSAGDGQNASFALSGDATTLAIGAVHHDVAGLGGVGEVRVFRLANGDWAQIGLGINGLVKQEWFGSTLSLTDDGNRLMVGRTNGSGDTSYQAVYDYLSGTWTPVGSHFASKAAAMSADGQTVSTTVALPQLDWLFHHAQVLNFGPAPDTDGDAVDDLSDNCVADPNPTQIDVDGDGIGDACDPVDGRTSVFGGDPPYSFNVESNFCGPNGMTVTVDLSLGQVPTNGNDVIKGTPGPDEIYARGGDDVICAGGGDDRIFGVGGNDSIFGQDGDDVIIGGDGNDFLNGGDGNDTLYGVGGFDDLRGNAGDDLLSGGDDQDLLDFSSNLAVSAGNDILLGGPGNDFAFGGDGNDTLSMGSGQDVAIGHNGADVVLGGPGIDALVGDHAPTFVGTTLPPATSPGSDIISGGDGDDLILFGGPGHDQIFGGAGNDILSGDTGNDILSGGTGDDDIVGGVGNDSLYGGLDDDSLAGEGGVDLLSGGPGVDHMGGGAGDDLMFGGSGDDVLVGEAGVDSLYAGSGDDTLDGGADSDTIVHGQAGIDTCTAGVGGGLLAGCEL